MSKTRFSLLKGLIKEVPDTVRRTALRRQAYISWLRQFNYWLKKPVGSIRFAIFCCLR